MSQIRFGGQLTEQQFRALQSLAVPWFSRHLFLMMLGGFFLIAMSGGGWQGLAEDPRREAIKWMPALLMTALAVVFQRLMIRKAWRRNALIKTSVTGTADDVGMEWNSEFMTGRYPWSVMLKHARSAELALVFIAPNTVLYFPREFFANAEDWGAFNELVAAKLRARRP